MRLTLASASPQRRALLTQLGVDFEVRPSGARELTGRDASQVVVANAMRKAKAVGGDLVLGVDTLVALDGEVFGKPPHAEAALETLRKLAGRTHEVWSGIAVRESGTARVEAVRTAVTFAPATDAELRAYVATGEWEGRAGAYAIQERGAWLVERVEGDYSNVVGLPISALRRLLPDLLT